MRQDGGPFEFYKFKDGAYDFLRCWSCGSLFTREQECARKAALEGDPSRTMCPCGSMRYKPAKPKWYQWLQPHVLSYTLKLLLARGLAPWLEERYPKALPLVERLVRQAA
jgi:hypothetical protein